MTIYHTNIENKTLGSRPIEEAYFQSDTDISRFLNSSSVTSNNISANKSTSEKSNSISKSLKDQNLQTSSYRMMIQLLGIDETFYQI
jgi:hypothetical protein